MAAPASHRTETATLGGGCFWCLEAVFQELKGVESVTSGYAGGTTKDPSYEDVCTGATGHAEVVQLRFDPTVVSYADLLRIFFSIHDPTTLNRQGPDSGTQYRSIVLASDEAQLKTAQAVKSEIDGAKIWRKPIVTTIEPLHAFYEAEEYHRNYYRRNPDQAYCRAIVEPKVLKFRKQFADRLRA